MRWFGRSLTILVTLLTFCVSAKTVDLPPFSLSIGAGQVVTVGDEISVTAVLKNISKRIVSIEWGLPYIVSVHNANGKTIQKKPGQMGYFGSAGFIFLASGQTSSQKVVISGRFGEYDLTEPGKYVIQLQRSMGDAGYPRGSMVESNKITITVLPKKPNGSKRPDETHLHWK